MSSRSRGGPRISAWSRKPSTKDRKAGTIGHTDPKDGRSVRAASDHGVLSQGLDGPPGLLRIDEQLGDDLIVVAQSPRGRRARLLLQRPGEGVRASLGDQRPLHPVEAEQALLAATVIPGRQVPLAPAVGEPPGVHQTGFTLVPEPQPSPLGDRREGGRHGFAARQGGQPGAPGDLPGRVLRTGRVAAPPSLRRARPLASLSQSPSSCTAAEASRKAVSSCSSNPGSGSSYCSRGMR